MKIHMTFKHMETTEAIKRHTNEKSEKLKRYLGEATDCHWVFWVEAGVHVAEARVSGPHIEYFAQSRTPDLYQSIEDCVVKIEKQLRKHKEIVKDHLHRNNRASGSGTP